MATAGAGVGVGAGALVSAEGRGVGNDAPDGAEADPVVGVITFTAPDDLDTFDTPKAPGAFDGDAATDESVSCAVCICGG